MSWVNSSPQPDPRALGTSILFSTVQAPANPIPSPGQPTSCHRLHTAEGNKLFDSVIIVTDRNVLDAQLQDTIYQFEHVDGVVGRINRDEGEGSKSEKLASALTHSQPIIIVTIQTFPFVLKAIEADINLKERHYAVIADEAHSSQTGSTARKLKEVLMIEGEDRRG